MSHVLGPFSKAEQPCVGAVLDAVLDGIQRLQHQSFERAGTWINGFRYDLVGRLMPALPATTAHLRVLRQCFQAKCVEGEVSAGGFEWQFSWAFDRGELVVEPSLGRALIEDALRRFLVRSDYRLEPGGDYSFMVRARF